MIPKLKTIWRRCFGDPEEAIDFIFSRLIRPENMLVIIAESGEPAAMLSIRELTLDSQGNGRKAAYVFAVATMPEYQGRGYGTRILEEAHRYLAGNGYACSILAPAEESLFDFYSKRGYEPAFNINRVEVSAEDIHPGYVPKLSPLSPENFFALRNDCFGGSSLFARWDLDYLKFIIEDCRFWGGDASGFSVNGKEGYAVCYRSGDTIYVKELAAPDSGVNEALMALKEKYSPKSFVLYLHEDIKTLFTNKILPFAMIKWYDNTVKSGMRINGCKSGYIAHVLD